MKTWSILFLGAFAFWACNNTVGAGKKATSPFLIEKNSMGGAKVGMTQAELMQLFAHIKHDTFNSEALLPCWQILDKDSVLFSAIHLENSDTISFFATENPKMRLANGIGVGSSYLELQTAFPDVSVNFAEGLFAVSDLAGIGFGLTGPFESVLDSNGMPVITRISPETKISTVELYQ